MKIALKIFLSLLSLCFFDCNRDKSYVDQANDVIKKYQKQELEQTFVFFRDKNPEKLKAAYVLIAGLENSISGLENQSMEASFELIVPMVKKKGKTEEVFDLFNSYLDSLSDRKPVVYKRDVEIVNSNMLINNIELAYKAVELLPVNLQPDENKFFDYVLPYKNGFEPLEPELRENLLEEYGWIHSVIKENNTLESGVCALLDTLKLKLSPNTLYPGVAKISQINKIKFGACSDLVNLVVHILRALGIPATSDFTSHWGNHYALGHEWLVFFSKDKEYAIDVYDYRQLNNIYEYASLPKVFRKNFNSSFIHNGITCEDVTVNYKKNNASNIILESERKINDMDIGVFHSRGEWKMLNAPKNKANEGFLFENVGNDIIYGAEKLSSSGEKNISPFYINPKNEIQYLIPDHTKKLKAVITRKYPPSVVRDNGWKESWVESIGNCKILGANKKDFSDAEELYNFKEFASYNPITIDTQNEKVYKYYLLQGDNDNPTHLAEFYPMDNDGIQLDAEYQITGKETAEIDQNLIRDNNPLTFIEAKLLKVLIEFKSPTKVRYFKIQARNDDNNIKPGDEYELMHWEDNKWVSLGRRVATDTVLYFDNTPSKSVYWLRNHSQGKEEHVFLLDSLGKQYWPGVTSLKKKLENYWFCSQ